MILDSKRLGARGETWRVGSGKDLAGPIVLKDSTDGGKTGRNTQREDGINLK